MSASKRNVVELVDLVSPIQDREVPFEQIGEDTLSRAANIEWKALPLTPPA